jgi:Flp pilus assembly protein protease CpaA
MIQAIAGSKDRHSRLLVIGFKFHGMTAAGSMEGVDMPEDSLQFEIIRWLVILLALVIACVTDIRARRIPNILTFPLFLIGLLVATLVGGFGTDGLTDSLLGTLLLGGPFMLVYIRGGGGAGDAKLMFGIGAWSGIDIGFYLIAGIAVVGICWSFLYASFHGGIRPMLYSVLVELWSIIRGHAMEKRVEEVVQGEMHAHDQASPVHEDGVKSRPQTVPFAPIALGGVIAGGLIWLMA